MSRATTLDRMPSVMDIPAAVGTGSLPLCQRGPGSGVGEAPRLRLERREEALERCMASSWGLRGTEVTEGERW